jgi:hypothetical protein
VEHRRSSRLAELTETPFAALAPWIVMALLEEPLPFEWAVAGALAVALAVTAVEVACRLPIGLLQIADVLFFAGLAVVAVVADEHLRDGLEEWAGEISAGAIALIAAGSIVARHPFTIVYARRRVRRELWATVDFVGTNYVISACWAAAFAITALGGVIGHAIHGGPGDFWTNWAVQAGTVIVALQFSRWYPDVVRARARARSGLPAEKPTVRALVLPLCPYVVTLGVLALVLETAPDAVGVTLIVLGAVLTRVATARPRARA